MTPADPTPAPDTQRLQDDIARTGPERVVKTILMLADHPELPLPPALVTAATAVVIATLDLPLATARAGYAAALGEPHARLAHAYLQGRDPSVTAALGFLRHHAPQLHDIVTVQHWRAGLDVHRTMATQWAQQGRLPGAYRSPDVEGGTWLVDRAATPPAVKRRGRPPRPQHAADADILEP